MTHSCSTTQKLRFLAPLILALVLAFALAITAEATASDDSAISKATSLVAKSAKAILFVAHPTADYQDWDFKRIERTTYGNYRAFFEITYKGGFFGLTYYLEFYLELDSGLGLKRVGWGRDTGIVPPGTAAGAVLHLLNNNQ
jgi:hypothetical protein